MGGNAIRRDLGADRIREVSQLLRESINYSLTHRDDALQYAMQCARDMQPELADRFVAMCVNDLTLYYTERGREAVKRLLDEGFKRQIIPHPVQVDFVDA
jgi:1,4-dihydroxy-6-naphthoate synthase